MEKTYTKSYIAFLDILGFKNMIASKTCQELYTIFTDVLTKPLESLYRGQKIVIDMSNVKMKVMSDSVCFYIDASIENSLIGLIATCLYFQVRLLRLEAPILLRGAITCGDLFADGDTIFGPGFVKAYQMEESNAKYPRIIITERTIDMARERTTKENEGYIKEMTFLDYDAFYALDYCELFEGFDTSGADCHRIWKHICGVLAETIDTSIREKYMYLKKNLLRWYNPQQSVSDLVDEVKG